MNFHAILRKSLSYLPGVAVLKEKFLFVFTWSCFSDKKILFVFTWSCLSTSEGKTSPGESHSLTEGVRNIVWKCLVWPGVLEELTTLRPQRPFMSDDLPTLGQPGVKENDKKDCS